MNRIIGGDTKISPLIHFNSLVDSDYGLIELIKEEYLDPTIFDINFFNKPKIEIIKSLYNRSKDNPLSVCSSLSDEDLDDLYNQFMNQRYYDILDKSATTEIANLIEFYDSVGDIKSTILCNDEIQVKIIKETNYLRYDKIICCEKGHYKSNNIFNCAYFKKIEDIDTINDFNITTYYLSTFGPNLTADKDDVKESDIIDLIAKKRYNIHLIDLYKFGGK